MRIASKIIGNVDNLLIDTHPKKNKILVTKEAFHFQTQLKDSYLFRECCTLRVPFMTEEEFNTVQRISTRKLKRPLQDLPLVLGAMKLFQKDGPFSGKNANTIESKRKIIETLFSPFHKVIENILASKAKTTILNSTSDGSNSVMSISNVTSISSSPLDASLNEKWSELVLLTQIYSELINLNLDESFPEIEGSPLNYLSPLERAAYITSIIDNNSFSDSNGCLVLFETASRMSHSCLPNCSWSISDSGVITVKPLRSLQVMEEITISYFSFDSLENEYNFSTVERRKYLLSSKHFICECPMCSREDRTRCFKCTYCESGQIFLNDRLPSQKKSKDKKKMDNKCIKCKDVQQANLLRKDEELWIIKMNRLQDLLNGKRFDEVDFSKQENREFSSDELMNFAKEVSSKVHHHWILYFLNAALYYIYIRDQQYHKASIASKNILTFLEFCYAPLIYHERIAHWYQQLGKALQNTGALKESIHAYELSMGIFEFLGSSSSDE